jgi:transposase InsO family protein
VRCCDDRLNPPSTCQSGTQSGWPKRASSRRSAARGIHRRGPWKGLEEVEFATLEWVAWYNGSRLFEPLGYVPPAEFEKAYHDRQAAPVGMAVLT